MANAKCLLTLFGLICATAARAEDAPDGETLDTVAQDWLTIGAGAAYGPSYSGSDESVVYPAVAVMGRIGGYRVSPRVAGVAVDLIRDDSNDTDFTLGPVLGVRFDRSGSNLKDPVVEALGKRDAAVEAGIAAGVGIDKVLHGYDRLDIGVDVTWDLAGAHGGMIVSPGVSYQTPLSKGAAVVLALSADYWSGKTSRYYWSVSPAQSLASGLPVYVADSGFNSVSLLGMGVIDLDGNLLNGGFAVVIGGGYQRLTGSAKHTPITRLQGDADQFVAGIGVGYTFF